MINELLDKLKNNIGQLSTEEYEYIIPYLGDVNFLVFGTGNDSELWNHVNKNGYTVFLENQDEWIKPEYGNVVKVNYTCNINDHKRLLNEFREGFYDNLMMELPDEIMKTRWDVIFIDSPTGYSKECHGRMQSIFMGYKLSDRNTHVFIHDCNREVEDTYSREMFNVFDQVNKLRYLRNTK